jgi:transposase
MYNIAFDSHKRYTLCVVEDEKGRILEETRIDHERGYLRCYLKQYPPGTSVAVETIGNWYWIVDEIEEAGLRAVLVHARKAKLMLGNLNKTDRLDARGLNRLQRTGTLPTVWIPPGELRDKRDLPRSRMYLVNQRTCLKNRIYSTLCKYALELRGVSDIFGKNSRSLLEERIGLLPDNCRFATRHQLHQIDSINASVIEIDQLMHEVFDETEEVKLLRSMPGIGFIFGIVTWLEVGDINRFASPQKLASYSGTVPRVHSSGGRTRYGNLRPDVNRYLKWAYCEAANTVNINKKLWPDMHVTRLYERIRHRKGHAKAVGAVARHLAESTYWILKKKEPYKDPALMHISSRKI